MYLKAQEITYKPTTLLDEWKGRTGRFVKTFGIDDTRNENKWRSTWEGIKNNIKSAINRPGIAFEKCNADGCGLDHVEAETFQSNIKKQEPYEKTKIIDFILNEEKRSADVIHEVFDDDFWEKLQKGLIRYVSPMIWPKNGGAQVLGFDEQRELPIIDSHDWDWVHTAFLEEKPAFGTDKANVKLMCEGSDCDVKLLSAKALEAEIAEGNSDNLSHLQQIPLLIRHKGSLVLASASSCVQNKIREKADAGIEIDDQALAIAYSECGESKSQKSKSSFKTCACSAKHNMSAEEQNLVHKLGAMEEEKKNLESKLKAMEDEKSQQQQAKKGRYAKLFAQTKEEDAEKMVASLKAQEDEEEYKAAKEAYDDITKAKKAQAEDPEKKKLEASLKSMQAKMAEPMINGLVAIRRGKMPEAELLTYEQSLKAKSFEEIDEAFKNESYLINLVNEQSSGSTEYSGLPFPGESGKPLFAKAKSIDEIMEGS